MYVGHESSDGFVLGQIINLNTELKQEILSNIQANRKIVITLERMPISI